MGIEKRQDERIVVSGDVLLNHLNNTIHCQIENISNYGAYLKVESLTHPPKIEIGDQVTFTISTPDIATQELSGQILRRSIESENIYLAVYFFSPYAFD